MNTFTKIAPAVFGVKTKIKYEKGDVTEVQARHGKIVTVTIYNLFSTKQVEDEVYYTYSCIRTDGLNTQTRIQRKADRYKEWGDKADKKSEEYYDKSRENSDFLSLGEPIKVGHHSERRHRKMIERAQNNATKSCEMGSKAASHRENAERLERRTQTIDLSMPESLVYFKEKLKEARTKHKLLKEKPELRDHDYSLTYAKKSVNRLEKKVALAERLWG